ncbi:MAG: WecB/TagA/CpsF family glycosyltransferase [Candidatus Pacearchaeota archaeon]|jgi:N-acetylglucosaminyldiphosphoundecaprenol N-acetyl-beta-D-mannosaminyltransferase
MDEKIFIEDRKNLKNILEDSNSKNRFILNFINSHDLYQFVKEPLFKSAILEKENINFLDGFIISLYISIKKMKKIQRLMGPNFTINLLNSNFSKNKKSLFIGIEREDLEKLFKNFKNLNQKKTFSYNPLYIQSLTFPDNEINKISKIINNKKIDIVWVGIGCPKQNILVKELIKKTKNKYFFNVGAGIDFALGKKKRAPGFFQKIGLEWIYRLITDFKTTKKKVLRSLIALKYLKNINTK